MLVSSDRRLGVRLILVEELNKIRETVRQFITKDFVVRKISAKMMPRILKNDQKQSRIHISSGRFHNAEMFDRVLALSEIKKCP
jgi:ethanolamine utilization protein EutQ (cupin superfamily)